jgi:hypothetical protein
MMKALSLPPQTVLTFHPLVDQRNWEHDSLVI